MGIESARLERNARRQPMAAHLNMKTYLRIVNPTIALVVLLLCLWASMNGDNGFRPRDMLRGGIPTYFLAKGLFCSSVLFLVGKIVSIMGEKLGK
jgi:ABC-type spermidine/putrescine transport system permease subunit II